MSADDQDLDLKPGDELGGFAIRSLIGQGAMGDVFFAQHLATGSPAALKILPPSFAGDPYALESFEQEMRITSVLNHPNINAGFASGEERGTKFLALKYVQGQLLEEVLERQGAVDERDAAFVVRQLSLAMKFAWEEHQIIHRDINPANIMIDTEGSPILIDLGLAQWHDEPLAAVLQGMIEGTPNYMSPEQVLTPSEIDFRTDMYALGATLYNLVTNQVPFGEYDEDDVLELLKNNSLRLTDPRKYNPNVTNGCVLLIEHMLARRPFKRHKSWDALVADLQLVEDGFSNRITPIPQEHSQLKREGVASRKGRSITIQVRTPSGSIRKVQSSGDGKSNT